MVFNMTSAPAASAREASSFKESSTVQSLKDLGFFCLKATKMAFSSGQNSAFLNLFFFVRIFPPQFSKVF